MKKALILFGGVSSEHDISLFSAKSVIENTPKDKDDIITRFGKNVFLRCFCSAFLQI